MQHWPGLEFEVSKWRRSGVKNLWWLDIHRAFIGGVELQSSKSPMMRRDRRTTSWTTRTWTTWRSTTTTTGTRTLVAWSSTSCSMWTSSSLGLSTASASDGVDYVKESAMDGSNFIEIYLDKLYDGWSDYDNINGWQGLVPCKNWPLAWIRDWCPGVLWKRSSWVGSEPTAVSWRSGVVRIGTWTWRIGAFSSVVFAVQSFMVKYVEEQFGMVMNGRWSWLLTLASLALAMAMAVIARQKSTRTSRRKQTTWVRAMGELERTENVMETFAKSGRAKWG